MPNFPVGKKTGLVISLAILLAVLLVASSRHIPESCDEPYRFDKTVSIDGRDIKAEVASSDRELEKGLSGRSCIGENQGMLFVFEEPGYYNFWMKDMKFPIDIVWIDGDKRIIEITDNVQPSTYPDTFTSNRPPQYILELKAGEAARLGMRDGTKLSFPLMLK